MANLDDVVQADEVTLAGGSEDYDLPANARGIKMIGRSGNAAEVNFRPVSTQGEAPIPENEWVELTDRNLAGRTISLSGSANDIVDILILKGEGE